ncbi:aldehyde dehydrogenase (NADP(+)) [Paucibacter sp. PLA-PC-4]|uniref:aldehyde dehydrogenase (NADP(+)) n=1 Tax=Paucibacter sp. PLA-PC-4 TaxID=2993655 RepID=UPI00224AB7F3|nr:aldehyde dehydrogenase (NADP(+)) [Paucibacter sp. PLA-PC-4]MCX2864835.1 aldehyde dehydrogenase (NADP(+)) [Paucibacter sp. PLA-PC-4]
MAISGEQLIGASVRRGAAGEIQAWSPIRGQVLPETFGGGDAADVERACALARGAADPWRRSLPEQRARLLETVAEGLLALGDALIERAHLESALPIARLQGERGRTVGQLRLFAQALRDGHWCAATLDSALPERAPLPRADLRSHKIGVGPVAVFGASNFPLAFSVAGGDTAAALAAGCPVIAKAHPAHPGTSELVGRVIQQAVRELGLPEGLFSLLHDAGTALGKALVAHPVIQAVGFTGSRRGGQALMAVAQARPQPIAVYAEMSAINPVFLLPAALAARAEAIAQGFAESLTQGVGQFCTNPGLLLALDGPGLQRFLAAAAPLLSAKPAGTMLTPSIRAAFEAGAARLREQTGVETLVQGAAQLCVADAARFIANPLLHEEVFGPAALLLRCRDEAELLAVAEALEGQLTATLQLDQADTQLARALLPVLERKAGRILANGFPTGVEVAPAMVHGGPWPASSSAAHTSVGTAAIERFLRPVCYQDLPPELLPPALQPHNPLGLWRLRDGKPSPPEGKT